LVIFEWWGLNVYKKRRADELAKFGYVAMAVYTHSNGRKADNLQDAGALATPFYTNMPMTKEYFDRALKVLKNSAKAESNNVAAVGYCF